MNSYLIIPLASLFILLMKTCFQIEIAQDDANTFVTVLLIVIGAVGSFMHPKKQKPDNKKEDK